MLKYTLTQLRARSYASWQTPGSTAIRVSSLVLDGIYTEAMDGLNAVPAPVADIGGALFGSRSENEIVIDDFEPIPFEYGLGNSFRLSDGDRLRLREILQRFHQHENLSILGWYRSKSCQDPALNEGDRELLETELCHSEVILLVRPSKFQPYEVKLYLGGEEQLQEAQQTTYFAFDTRTSSLHHPPGTDPAAVAAPTLRTGAALSRIEPLSNPDNPSKSFEPGNTVQGAPGDPDR